jgi:hypothetical protein
MDNDTPTSAEYLIFEDPLLRHIVALVMPALVSTSDLLSLTTLELTVYIHGIQHDFSATWQKSMIISSIINFIFAYARGYNLDQSSPLKFTDEITIFSI